MSNQPVNARQVMPYSSTSPSIMRAEERVRWLIRSVRVMHTNKCVIWPFGRNLKYGSVVINGKSYIVSRVSFFIIHGRWPDPHALHECDNPPCFNPKHIKEGDDAMNQRDRVLRGRHSGVMAGGMPPGENCVWAKLTVAQVKHIRKEYTPYIMGCDQLAKKYGVKQTAIYRIVKRITWRCVL